MNAAADAMLGAVTERRQNRVVRAGATTGLQSTLSHARRVVHAIDTSVESALGLLPALEALRVDPMQAGSRPANMKLSIGETYDAFFTPTVAGTYTFELRTGAGAPLATASLLVH